MLSLGSTRKTEDVDIVVTAEALNAFEEAAALDSRFSVDAVHSWTYAGSTPDYDSKTYRYSYQSLITPSSVFDYDTQTGKSILLKQQEVLGGYDPSQYVAERQWATARDGVKVPLSIVYKKGFKRDGNAARPVGQRCGRCGRPIAPGQDARRRVSGTWVHENCPAS